MLKKHNTERLSEIVYFYKLANSYGFNIPNDYIEKIIKKNKKVLDKNL